MNVVRALIRVDGLKVHQMAHNLKLTRNAVATMHVTGVPRDV